MNTFRFGLRPFINDAFEDFFEQKAISNDTVFKPATNISEEAEKFLIDIAIPGFSKEEISIDHEKNTLKIVAEKQEKQKEEKKYSCNEFAYKMKYERSFQLPETVDFEKISAKYNNGILEVILPKVEMKTLEAKKIQIQ